MWINMIHREIMPLKIAVACATDVWREEDERAFVHCGSSGLNHAHAITSD